MDNLSPVSIQNAEVLLSVCDFPRLAVGRGVPPHGSRQEVLVELESGVALTDEAGAWSDANMASLCVLAMNLLPSFVNFWRKLHLLEPLADEMFRARAKHPGQARLFEALGEEVGELGRVFDEDCICKVDPHEMMAEALQVACVAMRIHQEGHASLPGKKVLAAALLLEEECRKILDGGAP